MRLMIVLCGVLASIVALAGPASATTTVKVLETYPAGQVVPLGRDQNFYLHLAYVSDEPVQIWARPYFHGEAVNAGSNPSQVHPAGGGDALGWFFLMQPGTEVDEIRIRAGDGSPDGTQQVASYAVSILGSDQPAEDEAAPAWVTTLGAADAAAQKADYDKAMNKPIGAGDVLLFGGFMLLMLVIGIAGVLWPAWGLWRWQGGWRVASAVPAALMAFVILRIVVQTAADPTSHNLWPFEILEVGVLSLFVMLVFWIVRKFTGAARA
jgi:hypothetical protein